jgi:hypothetical protein
MINFKKIIIPIFITLGLFTLILLKNQNFINREIDNILNSKEFHYFSIDEQIDDLLKENCKTLGILFLFFGITLAPWKINRKISNDTLKNTIQFVAVLLCSMGFVFIMGNYHDHVIRYIDFFEITKNLAIFTFFLILGLSGILFLPIKIKNWENHHKTFVITNIILIIGTTILVFLLKLPNSRILWSLSDDRLDYFTEGNLGTVIGSIITSLIVYFIFKGIFLILKNLFIRFNFIKPNFRD